MPTNRPRRPIKVHLLMVSLLLQGLSGISGGVGLVTDPTGSNLQLPVSWLEGSPFTNYVIPGWFLLVVLGIFPLIALYGLWVKSAWSRVASVLVGLALIIWITVEILIIGYHPTPPLQLIYGLLGIAILVLGLMVRIPRR